jgi:hypothetical protein
MVKSTCKLLSPRHSELLLAGNANVSSACGLDVIGGLPPFLAKAPKRRDC